MHHAESIHSLYMSILFSLYAAAIVGQILGVIDWLVESQIEFGTITVDSLQQVGPALTGHHCLT